MRARARSLTHAFGNGTSALYAVLLALGCNGKLVALPATICPSVVAAVFATGNTPYFVDIERTRFGLDPAALDSVLPKVSCVVAVHAFGIPCKIDAIAPLCRQHGVALIEDCAQAEGATYHGEPVGTFGDAAIFSYGAGKIISAGGGGAATFDPVLGESIAREYKALPAFGDQQAGHELANFYKFFYNNLYPDRLGPYRAVFSQLLRELGPRLLQREQPDLAATIKAGQDTLAENVRLRMEKAAEYARLLASMEGIEILEFPVGAVPWRFNAHFPFEERQFVLRRLLREGWSVSSWYPDISQFMDPETYLATPLPNSVWLGNGILNLWVDAGTTEGFMKHTVRRLHELREEYRCIQRPDFHALGNTRL